MTFKKWSSFIVILIFLALSLDYLFLHRLFPSKKEQLLKNLNFGVEETLKNNPPTENALDSNWTKPITKEQLDTKFEIEIKKCFPEYSNQANSNQLLDLLKQDWGVEKDFIGIENFHFKTKNGWSLRLHLLTEDRTTPARRVAKFFKLDKEGLPQKLTPEEEKNILHELNLDTLSPNPNLNPAPSSDNINSFIKTLKFDFHQVRQDLVFKNGSRATINIINDNISELQILTPNKTFSCQQEMCHCQ